MIVITPQVLPQAKISSNAALSLYSAYNAGTNYLIGDRVYYTPTGALYPHDYESLTNPNAGNTPDLQPDHWFDLGVSNRFSMFDGVIGDATTGPTGTPLAVTIMPGQVVNSVALFGLSGSTLNVTVDDPVDGIVYDRDVSLVDNTAVTTWYAYFFEPIVPLTDVTLTDLPQYGSADVVITVDAGAGAGKIGEAVIGRQRALGTSNFGTQVGIRSYSRKTTDEFGRVSVVKRRNAKIADFDVTIDTASIAKVQRALAELDSVPTVFIGDGARQETIVYGFYLDFKIIISNPTVSDCTIQVEGLV